MTDNELFQRAGVTAERNTELEATARLLAVALEVSMRTLHGLVMVKCDPERPGGSGYTVLAGPIVDGLHAFRGDSDDLAGILREYLRYVINTQSP